MYKIFLMEDDATMAQMIAQQLQGWGYAVRCAENFADVMPEFLEFDPHLALIDVGLPFFNGYHWCSEIRKRSSIPVVFLSSASDNLNIVMAMNLGADDFVAKPVDLTVLTAKLGAVLRRAYQLSGKVPALEHRGLLLNLNDASFTYGDQRVELTKNEFRILQTLLEHRGKIVSRQTLMTRLWQMDEYVEENTLTVNVTRLRKKLAEAGLPQFITTKVGSGYVIL